jgi:hypothetical protein
MEQPSILFGYHFPKTGGTSFSFNFSQVFGEDKIVREGPHSRRQKFFARQPQIEEMYNSEWDAVRLVYGHGVTDRIFPMLPAARVDLVFVAREPMGLFASRIKHRRLMQSKLGREPEDVEKLRSDYKPNDMTRNLIRAYGSFIDGPVEVSETALRQVMQCVRFLFCTERLSEQLVRLNASFGLPPPPESRRVSQDRTDIRPADEAAFRTENRLDYLLHELALESVSADSDSADSLLFDSRVWEEKSKQARAAAKHAIPLQEGIASTIDVLIADDSLEAALVQMRYEKPGQRRNRGLYMQAAEAAMARGSAQALKPSHRKRNELNVLSVMKKNGDYSNLWERAQKFVDEHEGDARGLRFWKFAKREMTRDRRATRKEKRVRKKLPDEEVAAV